MVFLSLLMFNPHTCWSFVVILSLPRSHLLHLNRCPGWGAFFLITRKREVFQFSSSFLFFIGWWIHRTWNMYYVSYIYIFIWSWSKTWTWSITKQKQHFQDSGGKLINKPSPIVEIIKMVVSQKPWGYPKVDFFSWKIPSKNVWSGGTPMTSETPAIFLGKL